MTDELANAYQLRRPLLVDAAANIERELAEFLSDQDLASHTAIGVPTAEEFLSGLAQRGGTLSQPLSDADDQIAGGIEVYDFKDVALAEELIGKLHTIHTAKWLDTANTREPVRQLTCVIPTQAMPQGWRERRDLPVHYRLRIETTDKPQLALQPLPRVVYPPDPSAPFPLIMKGGGIKGLAYIGAIEELSKRYTFNWFVGTSAGAITAVLLGAGYTPAELQRIMSEKNFRDFFDAPWFRVPYNLAFHRGCYRGDAFTAWLDDLLAKKLKSPTRVKLSQLPHRVTVYACRVGQRTIRFDSTNGDDDAAYAARCSMSIPYVFTPQQHQGINTFDGGIHQNYPVEQFLLDHPNTPFVSLYLGPAIYEPVPQRFIFWDLASILSEGSDADTVSKYREQTVIIDPRPIGFLDFDLTPEEKEYLVVCGRAGALSHLSDGSTEQLAAAKRREEIKHTVETARKVKREANQNGRRRRNRCALWALAGLGMTSLLYLGWRLFL